MRDSILPGRRALTKRCGCCVSPNVDTRANGDACTFKGSTRGGSGVSLVRPNERTQVERSF